MQCYRCRAEVEAGSFFCPFCGAPLAPVDPVDEIKQLVRSTREETASLLSRLDLIQERFESLQQTDTGVVAPGEPSVAAEPPRVEERSEPAPGYGPPVFESRTTETQVEEASPDPSSGMDFLAKLFGSEAVPSRKTGLSEVHFGQKWLLIVGIAIMVLGIGYFLKYSFDRNWVGPAGRVAMSYFAGMACLAGGEFLRRRLTRMFGLYLTGGGIAVLYFSTFAAFQIYALMSHVAAFGIMIMVTALACSLSLFYDARWLAVLGIIGGFLTPVVLSTGVDNQVALMTYMVMLNGGILGIAFFKRWALLNHLGLASTWILFAAWYFEHYAMSKFWPTVVFLNIFFLIYAVAPFAFYFIRERVEELTGFALTIPNAFVAFAFSFATIAEYYSRPAVSIVTVAYTAVFSVMASYLYRKQSGNLEPFILLLAKALVFLVITVPVLFSDHWITVFWIAQAGGIIWAALRLNNRWLYIGGLGLLAAAAVKFLLYDYPGVFHLAEGIYFRMPYGEMMPERWLTSAVVVAALYTMARLTRGSDLSRDIFQGYDAVVLNLSFTILLFIVLNVEVSGFFEDKAPQARFASISVLWALFSIGLMGLGFAFRKGLMRRVSIGLFAVTVLKVFLVDMSNVSTPFRIVSFIVLGVLLIGASFLYHRYKGLILSEDEAEGEAGEEAAG
ncbi:MAG: DUF2339 domain-containing protein [bacterium]|nr:DUF2339 domain-containing protein [bacterium]